MARPADPNARAALILGARREFVKHGIQGARIEDITAACKLSKGAFYLHFESKEALFTELVAELDARVRGLATERSAAVESFRAQYGLKKGKVPPRFDARALEALRAIEGRFDLMSLEMLWDYRDVVDVLMRGSRGTAFEGFIWGYLDAEVQRIAGELETYKAIGLCRTEVPSEVAGSMLIGTYIMLARRMTELTTKPDLGFWVQALKVLLNDGMAPDSLETGLSRRVRGSRVTVARKSSKQRKVQSSVGRGKQ